MVKLLIRKGADVRSTTSNGGTVHHLAIAEYAEEVCYSLVKNFIEAGCNSEGRTVLEAAIERGYTSVVGLLLVQCPISSRQLVIRATATLHSQMIQLLIRDSTDNPTMLLGSHWDNILLVVHAAYSRQDRQQVTDLDAARKVCRTCPSPGPKSDAETGPCWVKGMSQSNRLPLNPSDGFGDFFPHKGLCVSASLSVKGRKPIENCSSKSINQK